MRTKKYLSYSHQMLNRSWMLKQLHSWVLSIATDMAHSLTAPASRTSDYLEDSKISNVWKHHEHHHLFGSSTRSSKNGSILKELADWVFFSSNPCKSYFHQNWWQWQGRCHQWHCDFCAWCTSDSPPCVVSHRSVSCECLFGKKTWGKWMTRWVFQNGLSLLKVWRWLLVEGQRFFSPKSAEGR